MNNSLRDLVFSTKKEYGRLDTNREYKVRITNATVVEHAKGGYFVVEFTADTKQVETVNYFPTQIAGFYNSLRRALNIESSVAISNMEVLEKAKKEEFVIKVEYNRSVDKNTGQVKNYRNIVIGKPFTEADTETEADTTTEAVDPDEVM